MRRRLPLLIVSVLAAAWALRLHDLGRQELWFDEAASYFIATKSLHDILGYVSSAVFEHPPLYYLVLHYCVAVFGSSEWALRFPSACFGLLLVAGVWRAARPFDRCLAAVATVLAAASAFLVTYSQEARMYALLQCLGLLATVLLYRALRRGKPLGYAVYALAMLVGVLTHYFFAFLFVAHAAMAVAMSERPRQTLVYAASGAAALLLAVAAWVASAPGLRQALLQMWRQSLWGKSAAAVASLGRDWAFGGAIIGARPAWEWLPTVALLLLALLGLSYADLSRRQRLALGLWAAVPIVCAIGIPYGGLALRHVSYVTPALLALTAAGLLRLRRPLLLAFGAAVVAAAAVPGLAATYSLDKGDYGEAMAVVASGARPDDLLILGNPHQWVLAEYYQRSGLAEQYVGDNRALPALDPARPRRLWSVEWETWALPDWTALATELRRVTFEGEARAYSNDLSLRLLYVAPDAAPTTTLASASWDATRAAEAIRTWAAECRPGDAALVEVAWRQQPPLADTAIVLRLVDAEGHVWAQQSGQPLPVATVGDGVTSRHALVVPGGTPPGLYAVELGVIDLVGGAQMAATGDDGGALGPWLRLADVNVVRAAYPAPDTDQEPQALGTVVYHGSEVDASRLVAGDRWSGLLQFEARDPAAAGDLSFALAGRGGEYNLGSLPLAAGTLPAAQWQSGEVWRCAYEVRLPADLPAGRYRLVGRDSANSGSGGIFGRLAGSDAAVVDEFDVTARQPSTVAGTPSIAVDATFAGQVRLEGLDIERDGDGLVVRLYWQALGPTAEPQKVFVHLAVSGVGEPLAQDDAWPAGVATNDWLSGERFLSEHSLPPVQLEAAKSYVLRVGLYNERTMARLPAEGADAAVDHVEVPLALP
ncbi:MAG: glycosyltransferase family 39 protein [Anaerolineae bacterium]